MAADVVFRSNGSCLLDAVVEMVEMLLKEEYFDYSEDQTEF